jgi:hypothetical protein
MQNYTKNSLLISGIFLVTLALNFQVISYNMFYYEQPLLYLANSQVSHFSDLLNVYLHPKLFHYYVPFFRPSGHFLMYYVLAPMLGWHNTQAFLVVNLFVLSLCGWWIVKIYRLLFPGFVTGGFIAYAMYLMHPALAVSRLSVMHFEYAHVFFILASLYFFIIFCKQNACEEKPKYFSYLIYSLVVFAIGVTFKEPALGIGPMLFAYFCLVHRNESARKFFLNKSNLEIVALLTVFTLLLAYYITFPWRDSFQDIFTSTAMSGSRGWVLAEFVQMFFGLNFVLNPNNFWQQMQISSAYVVAPVMVFCALATIRLFVPNKEKTSSAENKSLLFLACTGLFFLMLPMVWGMAMPWHLNPVVLFFGMMFGFACEKLFKKSAIILVVLIALITPITNSKEIHYNQIIPIVNKININAVTHPPVPKSSIKPNTIILVEDSIVQNPYGLAASFYPYVSPQFKDANQSYKQNKDLFSPFALIYGGNLFRYAYLMSDIKEEVYPFMVEKMNLLPDETIYSWLQDSKNILCLGYDMDGKWHDKTAIFIKNLMVEQHRRGMHVNPYHEINNEFFKLHAMKKWFIPIEDPRICQQLCDKESDCKGFVMLHEQSKLGIKSQCLAYSDVSYQRFPCPICNIFVKEPRA